MRYMVLAAAFALTATQVLADGAPMPPKGKKYVVVNNSIAVDKSVKGYVFVQMIMEGRGRPSVSYTPVKLTEKAKVLTPSGKAEDAPAKLAAGMKLVTAVIAIPEEAAKKYATEKELLDAVATIPGTHRLGIKAVDAIPENEKRESIAWKYTITAIDPKKGITATTERDGKPYVESKDNPSEEEDNGMSSSRVPAGLFAMAAAVSLGLWLTGRRRTPAREATQSVRTMG